MRKFLCLFVVLLLMLSVFGCAKKAEPQVQNEESNTQQSQPTLQEDVVVDKLPDFDTVDLYGNKVTQEVFKESKLTIVTLWATF